MIVETEPCKNCDFAPCVCGRDIEDCMKEQGEIIVDNLTNDKKYVYFKESKND